MKIYFSKNEYKDLLDIVYLADWVLNATKISQNPKTKKYNNIFQRIYSHAIEYGLNDLVIHSTITNEYHYTDDFDKVSPLQNFINDYDNDTFWEELIDRLTERDLIRQVGGEEKL